MIGSILVAFFELAGLYINAYIPAAKAALGAIILFQIIAILKMQKQ